jgi:hypothetical protein
VLCGTAPLHNAVAVALHIEQQMHSSEAQLQIGRLLCTGSLRGAWGYRAAAWASDCDGLQSGCEVANAVVS